MTTRLRPALMPVLLCLALPLVLDARPGGTDAKGSAARTAPGTARPIGPTSVTGSTAVVSRATTILGSAWTADNSPIPQARIRLRNVISGRVEASTVANDLG